MTGASTLATEFAKSHGKRVHEIMTSGVISVAEDTPLSEIAGLFERKGIKRVPVVTVSAGVVHLWELVGSVAEREALLALAEGVPGVSRVADEMIPAY